MRGLFLIMTLFVAGCSSYPKINGVEGLKGEGITDKRWCREQYTARDHEVAIYKQFDIWVWQPRDGTPYILNEVSTPTGRKFFFEHNSDLWLDDSPNLISYSDYTGKLRITPQKFYWCDEF